MSPAKHGQLSFMEAFNLPVVVDVPTAARALGICLATAYRLARQDAFPCKILRIGTRYRVPTVELMRAIGVDERAVYTLDHRA
ncbi:MULTISPECIES: helix-turn-helix domain-containing protein [unclassified Kitasatospora]|uniref:helix-turn-helix domain-containing protein n=1 Tax=unclassified Kitasatospora TaxID=2633591 RepID=UPI00343CCE68